MAARWGDGPRHHPVVLQRLECAREHLLRDTADEALQPVEASGLLREHRDGEDGPLAAHAAKDLVNALLWDGQSIKRSWSSKHTTPNGVRNEYQEDHRSGLGASLAARFGAEGYRVALVARRAAPLDERVAELAGAGIEAAAFAADLTNLDGIPEVVRSIEAQFGAIDVAVYAPVGVTAMLLLTQQRRDDPFQSLCGPGGFARVPAVVDQQALAVDREVHW